MRQACIALLGVSQKGYTTPKVTSKMEDSRPDWLFGYPLSRQEVFKEGFEECIFAESMSAFSHSRNILLLCFKPYVSYCKPIHSN